MIRGQRWQRVKTLLDDALDLDSGARRAFLAQECSGDDLLYRQVESLLQEEEAAGDFLMEPIFVLGKDEDDSAAGSRLGPYQLIRELGSGGMGKVYLAERVDGEVEQQVAIKLLKRGLDTDEILRRFQSERQILANLSHLYVARFLDAGTREDGLPFFVMEYVEGEPITDYCNARRLSTRDRLKLFRKVCEAVHLAHQNLVVHRDLKPANILVTAEGTPKLLDFGIAKLLSDEAGSLVTRTSLGSRPMTPHYASPEQVRGGPVTTATDVYALGILLYEILTGHRPYRVESREPGEMAREVCEKSPARPSSAVRGTEVVCPTDNVPDLLTPEAVSQQRGEEPAALRRSLRGDLDNIVLKALRKEPERRFSSVEQLSEDIRRHLENLPVRSRPDTVFYRMGKFLRRHRWGVSAVALLTVSILGFAITMATQRQQIARERDRSQEVTEFLVEFLKSPDPTRSKGESVTVRQALDVGVSRLRSSPDLAPEIRATLLDAIGQAYWGLALYQQAEPLLEEALALRRATPDEDPALVAESLHNLASVKRGLADAEGAETLVRQALEIQRRIFPSGHRDLARGLNNLALLMIARRDLEAAESLVDEALDMQRRLFGREHSEVARTLNTSAILAALGGRTEAAERLYRESIEMRRQLDGPVDPGLAKTLNNLAQLLADRGDLAGALPLHQDALAMRRQIFEADHPDVVTSLANLALVSARLGEVASAKTHLEEGLAMERRLAGEKTFKIAVLSRNLAFVHAKIGEPLDCEQLIDQALEIFVEIGAGERRIVDAQSVRGGCLADQGRLAEAEPLLIESYQALLASSGPQARQTREALARIVAAYEAWGREAEADRYRMEYQGE